MKRIVLSTIAVLTLAFSTLASAGQSGLSIERVMAHTRDGGAWQPGQAVVIVFDVRGAADAAFPEEGLAVVMQVQNERTKCLDVPLRLIDASGGAARYAGVFYPFHEALFGGQVSFGASDGLDFTFQIESAPASAVSSTEELPAADPLAAAPLSLGEASRVALPAALVALLLALVPLLGRWRRTA